MGNSGLQVLTELLRLGLPIRNILVGHPSGGSVITETGNDPKVAGCSSRVCAAK
jgi:hypothetical protein